RKPACGQPNNTAAVRLFPLGEAGPGLVRNYSLKNNSLSPLSLWERGRWCLGSVSTRRFFTSGCETPHAHRACAIRDTEQEKKAAKKRQTVLGLFDSFL